MSMMKRVILTINKNNAGVKLSSPLKFYKNDSILLQFEIEKWNFEKKQDEFVKPMYAVAFVETPNGTDMIECTILIIITTHKYCRSGSYTDYCQRWS